MKGATALLVSDLSQRWSGLPTRIVSAVFLGVPVLAAVYIGRPVFDVVIACGTLIAALEWYRLCAFRTNNAIMAVLAGTLLLALVLLSLASSVLALLVLVAGAILLLHVSGSPWLTAGIPYIGLPCLALIYLRMDPADGRDVLFWLLAVVWASDVGAYACGRLIGGPKLAPTWSPNKTWAGLGGGIIFAALAGIGSAAVFDVAAAHVLVIISAILGGIAQGGDLIESRVKRHFGVKDTGSWIPGHGGLLDRVDALMAAALAAALIRAVGAGSMWPWH